MSADHAAESLYLVDAFSLIFQVFHAIPEMTSPSGLPTNAVFGFTKDMLYLRNQRKPTYLVVCFDEPGFPGLLSPWPFKCSGHAGVDDPDSDLLRPNNSARLGDLCGCGGLFGMDDWSTVHGDGFCDDRVRAQIRAGVGFGVVSVDHAGLLPL